ncbi:MAG: hypothetical protein QM751_15415 [Paludibacteraceae bacterium]
MKSFKRTLLLFGILGLLNACSDSDPIEKPTTNNDYSFDLGKAVYYGDIYQKGSNVFDIYLMNGGLDIDDNGYIIGTGYYVYLDLNASKGTTGIPTGTYNANTNGSNYTFQKGNFYTYTGTMYRPQEFNHPAGSYLARVIDGHAIEFYLLNEGSIKINANSITGSVASTDNVAINFKYTGDINSNIVDDFTPKPIYLSQSELWFWGDYDNVGLNIFTIRLGDSNTNLSELSGGGDMMAIEVYAPLSATTILPDGVYPVKVNSPEVNTTIDGYTDNGNNLGTWYYSPAKDYAITQGSLTVKHKTGNTYTLAFDFKDANNQSIVRSAFDISLGYYDKTSAPGVKQKMRAAKKAKAGNTINTKLRTGRTK